MRVDAEDQKLAEEMGEGIWFLNGTFYELYRDDDKNWHVNVSWGAYANEGDFFSILPDIQAEGIKLDKRHFDAIELVETLDKTDGDEDDLEDDDEEEEETVQITAAEEIVQNLFTARTVSDEEVAIGFIRNPKTNDVYKVVVQYIGNRSNE